MIKKIVTAFLLLPTTALASSAYAPSCEQLMENDRWHYQIISAYYPGGVYTGALQFNFKTKRYSLHGHQLGSPSFDGILENFECHNTNFTEGKPPADAVFSFTITANDSRYFSHALFQGEAAPDPRYVWIGGSEPFVSTYYIYTEV